MRLTALVLIITISGCSAPAPVQTTPRPRATDDWFWAYDDWDEDAPDDPPAPVRWETPVEASADDEPDERDEPADWSDEDWTDDDDFDNWNESPTGLTRELRELVPPGPTCED